LDLVVNKEYDIINIAKGETTGPGNVMKLTLTEETEDREFFGVLWLCQLVNLR
jgi:hypothetical protein